MGAVANMAPDLFGGIIADVPFVDVLNTMLDDTLPLTPPEWPEWGNPIDERRRLRDDRSPIRPTTTSRAKAYPPILALAGLTDPRVTYWEPAKWVARLREHKTGATDPAQDQHGRRPRRRRRPLRALEEIALQQAFALWCVGLADSAARPGEEQGLAVRAA